MWLCRSQEETRLRLFLNWQIWPNFTIEKNGLTINSTIHHNRWKSKISAVTKVAFAFVLVTATFSFSNKWHKHVTHPPPPPPTHTPGKLKLAEQIKWPYQLKKDKQKSLPNEVPELAERSFQNWSSNTCVSCKYCRSRYFGLGLSVPFLLLTWPRANPSAFL